MALFGFAKFFKAASLEEQQHAHKLVQFVNMRGGSVQLCDVMKPETSDFHDPVTALEQSISLEKNVLKVCCHCLCTIVLFINRAQILLITGLITFILCLVLFVMIFIVIIGTLV